MTLGEYIAQQVRQAIDGALQDSEDLLTKIAEAGGDAAHGGALGDVQSIVAIITDAIGAIPIVGSLLDLPLKPLQDVENGGGKLGLSLSHGYLLAYMAFQILGPLILPLQHAVAANTTNEIFDPNTAASLVAKGIIAQEFAFSEASGGGLDDQHEGSLIEAARNYPATGQVLEMLNRGTITLEQAIRALQRNSVHPDYLNSVMELRQAILSPADLALATLRGNIPVEEGYSQALLAGVNNDQFDLLIGNTGEPPGLMQMLEAYRRGFIDEPTLVRGIRQSRVRDEWIPMVEKLRYSPMSVADAVRAVVEHYMSDEMGAAIAQENGLLPEHWSYMVESWGRPLAVGQMLELMHRGLVTEDQVKQAVRESDIKDKYVDIAISLGRKLIPERQITQMIDHGVFSHDVGVKLLMEQGYTEQDSTYMVNLGTAMHIGSHHTLSKTDTLAMYTDALINRDQATKYLTALGYTTELAHQMLDLADYKRKAALAKVTMRGIEAELKAQHITADQAKQQLVKAGLDVAQADVYVTEWEQSRKIATRTLTESQTIKAIGDGVITKDDGHKRLTALGLDDTDIDILFKLNGFTAYVPINNIAPVAPASPTPPSPPAPTLPSGGAGLPGGSSGGAGL